MMTDPILALCYALGADETQGELLLPLARAAQTRLEQRLRPGVRPEDCAEPFQLAAALLVLDGLEQAQNGPLPESFSAGNVSVRLGGQNTRLQQAQQLLAPWSQDPGFAFQGVPG